MEREETTRAYTSEEVYSRVRRLSWGAILAGAVIAIVAQITLSLLGLGIGIGSIDPYAANPMEGLGVGALIWWVVSNLISIFIGAWFASRLAGIPKQGESIMNAMVTFGVYTLLSFYILTSTIGGILGGVGSVIGQTVHMAGTSINLSVEEVERLIKEGSQAIDEQTGEIDQETRQEMRYQGQQIAQVGSKIGIFMAIGLILGALAAAAGGKLGETHDLHRIVDDRRRP